MVVANQPSRQVAEDIEQKPPKCFDYPLSVFEVVGACCGVVLFESGMISLNGGACARVGEELRLASQAVDVLSTSTVARKLCVLQKTKVDWPGVLVGRARSNHLDDSTST